MYQQFLKQQISAIILVIAAITLSVISHPVLAQAATGSKLIVVQDKGGTSTQPYFEELGLIAQQQDNAVIQIEQPLIHRVTDSDMLPVYSQRLTPGTVTSRPIQAARLTPIFLMGEDDLSKRWLSYRREALIAINAIGLVVNVKSAQALSELRALAPELKLYPIAGDDIAERLNIQHYPVLITPTSIEQ